MESDLRIFRPRQKDISCVHWIDCYKKAEWCVEYPSEEGLYFDFFCDEHLKKLTKQKEKQVE